MSEHIWGAAFFLTAAVLLYVTILSPMMTKTSAVLGKPDKMASAQSSLDKVMVWLDGKKTMFSLGGMFLIQEAMKILNGLNDQTINELKALPYADMFTPAVAHNIQLSLLLLATFTHIYGKMTAAMTQPKV
jgi:hypothetical protein